MLLFSPARHRPVRRVSPPLREGRRLALRAGRMTANPVIPCPTNPTVVPAQAGTQRRPQRRSRASGNPTASPTVVPAQAGTQGQPQRRSRAGGNPGATPTSFPRRREPRGRGQGAVSTRKSRTQHTQPTLSGRSADSLNLTTPGPPKSTNPNQAKPTSQRTNQHGAVPSPNHPIPSALPNVAKNTSPCQIRRRERRRADASIAFGTRGPGIVIIGLPGRTQQRNALFQHRPQAVVIGGLRIAGAGRF